MKDYSETNTFIKNVFDLYEAVHYDIEYETIYCGKWYEKLLKTLPIKVNTKAKVKYEKCLDYKNYLENNVLSFDELFDFCSFVLSMEKSFFVRNEVDSIIYCEGSIKDRYERRLKISYDDVILSFELRRNATLTGMGEIIKIKITKMNSVNYNQQYRIDDGNLEYESTNDLMAINSVNTILSKSISKYFENICSVIYNDQMKYGTDIL